MGKMERGLLKWDYITETNQTWDHGVDLDTGHMWSNPKFEVKWKGSDHFEQIPLSIVLMHVGDGKKYLFPMTDSLWIWICDGPFGKIFKKHGS